MQKTVFFRLKIILLGNYGKFQFAVLKLLSYCFNEKNGFNVKGLVCKASSVASHQTRLYNNTTKEFSEKAIQFHEIFHGLKITN